MIRHNKTTKQTASNMALPQQQVQQAPAPQAQSLTPTELASAVAMAIKQSMPQQQPQQRQQRQMTEEELHARLGTFNPDMSLVHAFFGADPALDQSRLQALQMLVQSIVANATGHARHLTEDYIRRYHEHISDQLEDARFASNDAFYKQIYDGHEGLRPFDGLLKEMLPAYEQAQDYPADRAERAKYVREKFLPHVKAIQPDFDPTRSPGPGPIQPNGQRYHNSPQQPSGQQQQQTRQQGASLPSLGGGQSGATAGASSAGSGDPFMPKWVGPAGF